MMQTEKTVCFSGHRGLPEGKDLELLRKRAEEIIDTAIQDGYGRKQCPNMLPEDLLECLDIAEYGRKIAEKNGVSMTRYGALIPKNGVPLMEKLAQLNEVPSQGMTMGQTM